MHNIKLKNNDNTDQIIHAGEFKTLCSTLSRTYAKGEQQVVLELDLGQLTVDEYLDILRLQPSNKGLENRDGCKSAKELDAWVKSARALFKIYKIAL